MENSSFFHILIGINNEIWNARSVTQSSMNLRDVRTAMESSARNATQSLRRKWIHVLSNVNKQNHIKWKSLRNSRVLSSNVQITREDVKLFYHMMKWFHMQRSVDTAWLSVLLTETVWPKSIQMTFIFMKKHVPILK